MDVTYSGRYTLQWHITHRCNLRCTHCYQEDYMCQAAYKELSEILEKYIRFCRSHSYAPQINLTGGEPLSHPDFFRLIDEISRQDIPFSILTNGTLIDQYTADRIAMRHPVWVQVSLDGTEKIHDSIRGDGSFGKALSGIDCLKRSGVPVIVSFTAQRMNVSSLLPLAIICRLHHVDFLWWDRVVSSDENVILPRDDFSRLLRLSGFLHRLFRNERGNPMVGCGRALQFMHCPDSNGYVCSAGKSLTAVLADGSVMPCRRLPYIIGNVHDGELDEIFQNSSIIRSLQSAGVPEECIHCADVDKCKGGSRCVTCARTGSPFMKDTDCSRIIHK